MTRFVLHVDARFNATEHDSVVDGFMEWERDSRGIVKFAEAPKKWNSAKDDMDFAIDDDKGCTVDVYVADVGSDDKGIREMEKGPSGKKGNTLGYTVRTCETKYVALVMDRIRKNENPNALRFVSVHEAGHLVGLAHIPVPDESVMFPSMDRAAKGPTRLDMAQFCLHYGCKVSDMKYGG